MRACRQNHHLVRRKTSHLIFFHNGTSRYIEVTLFFCNGCYIDHRPAHNNHLAMGFYSRIDGLLNTRYIRCECSQNYAAFSFAHRFHKSRTYGGFRPSRAWFFYVSRVRHKGQNPFITQFCKLMKVEHLAIHRRLVDFKVPCMNHGPHRCAEINTTGIRDGVVGLNKTNGHTTSLNFVTSGNDVEVLIGYAIFLEFIFHEATYKVSRIDRRIHLAHKIG